jgi:dihydropteroate synthase
MLRTYGRRTFDFTRRAAVMAILNRTPDSFYDQGATFGFDAALAAAERALADGADWLDVGGVKAGPGPPVSEAEELDRVLPLVEAIRERSDAVVSVDTFRPEVARRALAAGADVVNDPSGLHDPRLAEVAAGAGAGLVVMHTGGPPRTRPHRPAYADVVAEVRAFLLDRVALARQRGVAAERLILDPGHDFHKNTFHSLELTRRLPELTGLGYPVLVAFSNKDFVGETLDLPVDQRLEGSLAAAAFAVAAGASIIRVHDVQPTVRVVRMTEAILGRRPPAATRRGLA